MSIAVPLKLTASALDLLRCPICQSQLTRALDRLNCVNADCTGSFPIVEGVPVLINESRSLFRINDFVTHQPTTVRPKSSIIRFLTSLVPDISHNLKAAANYRLFADLLQKDRQPSKVLIIGGGVLGEGVKYLCAQPSIELIETDVYLGERTALICDGHDLPFERNALDGVIVQAVLEHVVDPYRCVAEIHRVLKANGLVYAETPFMQQVHLGRYDFTRFTHLGHRRLFRSFEEIASGAMCGPGMALAWAYEYFLLSFTSAPAARVFLRVFARFSSFWLKYFDYFLIDKPGALDAASGYYFMGKKSDRILSDRELIKLYRGALS